MTDTQALPEWVSPGTEVIWHNRGGVTRRGRIDRVLKRDVVVTDLSGGHELVRFYREDLGRDKEGRTFLHHRKFQDFHYTRNDYLYPLDHPQVAVLEHQARVKSRRRALENTVEAWEKGRRSENGRTILVTADERKALGDIASAIQALLDEAAP